MRPANFNGVRVGELSVNFVESSVKVTAKAAFINTQNGTTYGWTTNHQWSADTLEKLRELRELMERDLEIIHFADGAVASPTTTGSGGIRREIQGIGEHLGSAEEDVPQG